MSDSKPNLEGPPPLGPPPLNVTRLEATSSQIGNTAQVVNSPGAVVNQVHVEQASSAVAGILVGMFGVLLLLLVVVLPLPGKLVPSGLALALIGVSFWLMVGGFFSWVESLLKPAVRFEITGWLIGVKVGQKVEPWPDTFAKVFDRVFGENHFSLKCLWRSCTASLILGVLVIGLTILLSQLGVDALRNPTNWIGALVGIVATNIIPDYIALLETRFVLVLMRRANSLAQGILLCLDLVLTLGTSIILGLWISLWAQSFTLRNNESDLANLAFGVGYYVNNSIIAFGEARRVLVPVWILPAVFTSVWLWLYAGAGFLLKAARRFDIGFQWFNAKFDIEKKPLQSIGLVAGALVAMVYWTVVIVSKLV